METARQGRSFIIGAIKVDLKQQATAEPATQQDAQIPWKDRMVLPPFLGELGIEIRYFLAAVEPWLRNGWRILAKRPELYPEGTAFTDPAFFAELGAVLAEAGTHPIGGAIRTAARAVNIDLTSELIGDRFVVSASAHGKDALNAMLASATLEARLRAVFARHYLRAPRPLTPWDTNLLTLYDARSEHLCGGALSLAPSYKPAAFLSPPYPAYPHVGLQMRRLPHAAGRDSDPALVLARAQEAATHLGLPLLVYGHPDGTIRPDGVPNSADLAGDRPLLRFELSMLSQCRLMFAPESGWCDLMCWLQIPTLLEKRGRPHEFTHNAVFRPRLALLDPDRPVTDQVAALLATPDALPPAPATADTSVYDDMDWDGDWIRLVRDTYVYGM